MSRKELSIENMVKRVTRAVSPFLLPMIEELGSLELNDVSLNRSDRNPSDEESERPTSDNPRNVSRKPELINQLCGGIYEHNYW